MNWIRASAIFAALGVHTAAIAALMTFGAGEEALQSGAGADDLSVVATVTLQSDEAIGLDAVTAERQEAAPAANPAPEVKQQEAKRDDAIEMDPPPPDERAPPQAPVQPKPVEQAEKQETPPSAPSTPVVPQQEQRAMSRQLEARRSALYSAYNAEIYRAIVTHTLRPKEVMKGRVGVELTLSPAGKLMARRVVKSSGHHLLDDTAMANLESVPYPTPPDGLVKEPYTVTFSFDYSVR